MKNFKKLNRIELKAIDGGAAPAISYAAPFPLPLGLSSLVCVVNGVQQIINITFEQQTCPK